ncbi:MAG: phosphoribosylglycinamide formyltransferase [Roseivirga sp.]|nr:phosphoribosylglycinamide formyltransferase [Roseivirga sp.]
MRKKKIAVFASGSGTNAEKIFQHFKGHEQIEVSLLCCNKPGAYVLERAQRFDIPSYVFSRNEFYDSTVVSDRLKTEGIDLIVLAGFMWLVPDYLVADFEDRIINIHPALLPKFGGKGMYGMHVHKAVKQAGETVSGITIHFVNNRYDEGNIIEQFTCQLTPSDTPEVIARKVQKLEHENYPKVIDNLVLKY